jgi:hypothetical protein
LIVCRGYDIILLIKLEKFAFSAYNGTGL